MIYVTSDWHGCELKQIKALLKKAKFGDNDFCFVLGNVIDYGENGVELLKWLMEQYNIELILGSHEKMLLDCEKIFTSSAPEMTPEQMETLKKWNALGAMPTIAAIKKEKIDMIEYIFEYLSDAPLFDTVNVKGRDFVFTHSGLGGFIKGKKLDEYTEDELLWNTPKLSDRYFERATTVFGHTPTFELDPDHDGKILHTDTWIDVNIGVNDGYDPVLLRLDDMKEFYAD